MKTIQEMSALEELFELDVDGIAVKMTKQQKEAIAKRRYINYHRRKMLTTYQKDSGSNQLKKAGVGAALGGIAGGILGGKGGKTANRFFPSLRRGLRGAGAGAAIGGVAGLGSPTRRSKRRQMAEGVKRRALREHRVRAYGQGLQRKGHSFYINPKYNKKTYA